MTHTTRINRMVEQQFISQELHSGVTAISKIHIVLLSRSTRAGSDQYDWAAATLSSSSAAGYQLALNKAVLPIGGFNGTDPYPTLEVFKKWVQDKRIHWFIAGSQFGPTDSHSDIIEWVEENYTKVDGQTLYDLSSPQ